MNIKHKYRLNMITNKGRSFYVRPLGGSYGSEDGSSYDNAFNGFVGINWSIPAGSTINIVDTHTETLNVGRSDIYFLGGVIDSESVRDIGINIYNHNNVVISETEIKNALISNLDIAGNSVGIVTNDIICSGSGNQSVQHQGSASATHNNITCFNNVDDGVSGHDNCEIIINGGFIYNNFQGVNAISNSIVEINDVTFNGNSVDAQSDSNTTFVINRCLLNGVNTVRANSTIKTVVNNSSFSSGRVDLTSIGSIEINDSAFWASSIYRSNNSNLSNSVLNRCYFEVSVGNKITTINQGVYQANYCVFFNETLSNIYAVSSNGGNESFLNNCTIVGKTKLGRGISGAGDITANNCIFNDLNLGTNPIGSGVVVTFNYANVFDVQTISVVQSGAIFVNNNPVAGDPLLNNVDILDFSLGIGSSCIGTGNQLVEQVGIDSALWGDISTVPIVTTKNQTVPWDVGAYIS